MLSVFGVTVERSAQPACVGDTDIGGTFLPLHPCLRISQISFDHGHRCAHHAQHFKEIAEVVQLPSIRAQVNVHPGTVLGIDQQRGNALDGPAKLGLRVAQPNGVGDQLDFYVRAVHDAPGR